MDYLCLRYGMQICLRSKLTQKYLSYNEQLSQATAKSMPPYIEIAGIENKTKSKRPSLKLKIIAKQQKDEGNVVTFGSKILLIDTQTNSYLTTVPSKSTIGFDKPGLHQAVNQMLQKTAAFIVLDQKNTRSRQPISVYDEVHFKSVMGSFIMCTAEGQVNIKSEYARIQTAWYMMKADTPYIPSWVYQRPTFSKFLNLQQVQIDPIFPKQQLGLQPANIQQMKLVQDILDVMLSFDGQYIKRNMRGQYMIQPQKQRPTCSSALTQLTNKILELPRYYLKIQNYISTYSIQQGTVCQALCSGLRQLVKQYKMMVIQFDQYVVTNGGLTLQEILYHIQPSLQLMESIVQLIKQAQQKKGGQLITCILKMLNGTTSEQVVKIYTFLFDKCIRVYLQMISKWIYQGAIEDKFQEFMIMEIKKDNDQKWNYWEQRYMLRRDQVPSIFEKDSHLILVTGKYLNILRICSGLEQHPLHKEIQKNNQKHIKNQDFTQNIMRAYDWANQKLQNLVMKQFKLEDVLRSLKGYYFLGFGDLFLHFMISAEDDLNAKNSKFIDPKDQKFRPISVQKLQNLFQLLIRTSSANSDPYKQQISCKLEQTPIYQQIHKIKILQFQNHPSQKPFIKKQSKNVDYFNLDFKCQFPLNLIINTKNLCKYQVLFRYLFWCKFIQRQLNSVWQDLQGMKGVRVGCFKKANLLTQKMLSFIRGLIYYLSYEVIQKNWRDFEINLTKVKNFQDIINYHNQFLAKCLNESLLINSKLLTIITNDLGNSCTAFIAVKKYINTLDTQRIQTNVDMKTSILVQRMERKRDIQKYFSQWVDEEEFGSFVFTLSDGFDKNMKKLLREIYAIVGKDQANSHLVGLLDTLDPMKFYNRILFEENKGWNYV